MPELDYGGVVVVQLWRSDCTEITGSKWRSHSYRRYEGGATNDMGTSFALPSAGMTVTTNDTANIEWTLS